MLRILPTSPTDSILETCRKNFEQTMQHLPTWGRDNGTEELSLVSFLQQLSTPNTEQMARMCASIVHSTARALDKNHLVFLGELWPRTAIFDCYLHVCYLCCMIGFKRVQNWDMHNIYHLSGRGFSDESYPTISIQFLHNRLVAC